MPRNRKPATLLLLLACGAALSLPRPAHALGRDTYAVIRISEYGLLTGTAVGLLTVPLSRTPRSIFIGSSVGLYLGIAVGIWYIANRNEPGNPLNLSQLDGQYPGSSVPAVQAQSQSPSSYEPPARAQVEFPVARF